MSTRLLGLFVLSLLLPRAPQPIEVTVTVVDASGAPRPKMDVELHVGLIHYALADHFDVWTSLETHEGLTGADGRATFKKIPSDSAVTAFAHADGFYGTASGTGDLTVQLAPTGLLKGQVAAPAEELPLLKIAVQDQHGWTIPEGRLDAKGHYELRNVPGGPVTVSLMRGDWVDSRQQARVEAGKATEIKRWKPTGKYVTGGDPLIACDRVKVVDAAGKPVADLPVWWRTPARWAVGNTDASGEVLLAAGEHTIGPPPYRLALGWLGVPEGNTKETKETKEQDASAPAPSRYFGRLLQERRTGAVVQIETPLREVCGRVRRAEADVLRYRLYAVSPGTSSRVTTADTWSEDDKKKGRKAGDFRLFLPLGSNRLVFGTLDGRLHEQELIVEAGTDSQKVAVVLDEG